MNVAGLGLMSYLGGRIAIEHVRAK
jgi:hypothetical protein